jgi:CRISPR-associated protein Cas2
MSLTVVVTRDVEDRYRGFLGSLMLEVAPGVYVAPRLSKATRERLLAVVTAWHGALRRGSLTVLWRSTDEPGGIAVVTFGNPPKEIAEHEGFLLMRRPLPQGRFRPSTDAP